MKKALGIASMLLLLFCATVSAADYNFVSQDKFKEWLSTGKKTIIVDIQVADEFSKRHFPGSLETNAYPVKTDEERNRLDAVLEKINASKDEVVIVCPRGGGGAKNTYDYLKAKGVAEKRLFILEKGMEGGRTPRCAGRDAEETGYDLDEFPATSLHPPTNLPCTHSTPSVSSVATDRLERLT